MSSTKTAVKVDIYQRVNEQILTSLEKGTPPWRRTWGAYGLAKNYISKNPYRGINAILMNFLLLVQGQYINHQRPLFPRSFEPNHQ